LNCTVIFLEILFFRALNAINPVTHGELCSKAMRTVGDDGS
jgi:hypothetical protein